MYVIDMQMLNDRGKKLVFGRAISAISQKLESGNYNNLDAVVVFVDELNKFAPSGNFRTPIKSKLIDITARGRSIGLVLFGAEQFASTVEKEIIENSSTYLFGRTEATELHTQNYRQFSNEIKTKLSMLPQGQLLASLQNFHSLFPLSFHIRLACQAINFRNNNLSLKLEEDTFNVQTFRPCKYH